MVVLQRIAPLIRARLRLALYRLAPLRLQVAHLPVSFSFCRSAGSAADALLANIVAATVSAVSVRFTRKAPRYRMAHASYGVNRASHVDQGGRQQTKLGDRVIFRNTTRTGNSGRDFVPNHTRLRLLQNQG